MRDDFMTKTHCDRCHKPLDGGRIMSMYNNDCICWDCKEREMAREDYQQARDAEAQAVRNGNRNFSGIGYSSKR